MIGNATWTLSAQDPGTDQADAAALPRPWTRCNIFDTQYFAADLETEAVQRRLAEALADQITIQLAIFFRNARQAARRVKLAPQRVGGVPARSRRRAGSCCCTARIIGMIRDRAAALVRAVAGSLDDPFLVAELERDDVGRLADEAASLALTGGRRVVRLREATRCRDRARSPAILKGPAPALVVLEASGTADALAAARRWSRRRRTGRRSPATRRKAGRWPRRSERC